MNDIIDNVQRIERIKDYFRKGDVGDTSILDMFTDDVEIYFPKFGTRVGKEAVGAFVQGLLGTVESLRHHVDDYTYIPAGDVVVVEGWESGVTRDGGTWPAKGLTDGRFCNVFRFRGEKICQVHIYVDPDFTGKDTDRYYWGRPQQQA